MEYLVDLCILFSIYGILAVSLNLMMGYTGLVSLAHSAFYGIGAYSVALLMTKAGWGFFGSLAAGMGFSALAALVIGRILSQFRGDYFILASLGMTTIVYTTLMGWRDLTGGAVGVFGIGRPEIAGYALNSNLSFLALSMGCLVVITALAWAITSSSFGRSMKAIREDEDLALVFGYRPLHIKMIIFTLTGMMASVAGGLFASYLMFVDPTSFTVPENVFMVSIIVLGGLANHKGSWLGAAILIALPEILRFSGLPTEIAAQMQRFIYGALLVLLMFVRPQGILGKFRI